MVEDKFFEHQSIIISFDVDDTLSDRLQMVSQAGFKFVEINSQDPQLLNKLLTQFPNLLFGNSNILSTQQLEDCHQAGFHFCSSPGFLPALVQTAAIYSINYLPGISTLSEAMHLTTLGYQYARPYPASLSFSALLNKNFPDLNLIPTEIDGDEIEHYFTLPAVRAVSILNPIKKQIANLSTLSDA